MSSAYESSMFTLLLLGSFAGCTTKWRGAGSEGRRGRRCQPADRLHKRDIPGAGLWHSPVHCTCAACLCNIRTLHLICTMPERGYMRRAAPRTGYRNRRPPGTTPPPSHTSISAIHKHLITSHPQLLTSPSDCCFVFTHKFIKRYS